MPELVQGHVGQSDTGDQAVLPGLRHRVELAVEQPVHDPQVHRRELLDAEAAQVVLDPGAQLGRLVVAQPASRLVPPGADLADQGQPRRVRGAGPRG